MMVTGLASAPRRPGAQTRNGIMSAKASLRRLTLVESGCV